MTDVILENIFIDTEFKVEDNKWGLQMEIINLLLAIIRIRSDFVKIKL